MTGQAPPPNLSGSLPNSPTSPPVSNYAQLYSPPPSQPPPVMVPNDTPKSESRQSLYMLTGMVFLLLSLGTSVYFFYQRNYSSSSAKAEQAGEVLPNSPLDRLTPTPTATPTLAAGASGGPTIPDDLVTPRGRSDCCDVAKAFDGHEDTFWAGDPANNVPGKTWNLSYVYASLLPAGASVKISYYGSPYYPASGQLDISLDGSTWSLVGQVVNQLTNSFVIPVPFRYARFTFNGGGQAAPYVREITTAVNGAALTPIPTAPLSPTPTATTMLTPTPTPTPLVSCQDCLLQGKNFLCASTTDTRNSLQFCSTTDTGGGQTNILCTPCAAPSPTSGTLSSICQAIKFYALDAASLSPTPPTAQASPTPGNNLTPTRMMTPTPTPSSGRNGALSQDLQLMSTQGSEIPRDRLKFLRPGDRLRIAVVGTPVILCPPGSQQPGVCRTKARIRVQTVAGGAWGLIHETTTQNELGEFYIDFTIPQGQRTFVVEAQVFDATGGWR